MGCPMNGDYNGEGSCPFVKTASTIIRRLQES